jgi:hypothetical protein
MQSGNCTLLSSPKATQTPSPIRAPGERGVHNLKDLESYLACPRKYFYRHILGLAERTKSAYVQFHQTVFEVLRWLREQAEAGSTMDLVGARAHLSQVWQDRGLGEHVYASFYREQAERMVERLLATAPRGGIPSQRHVDLQHGRVVFTPDHVEQHVGGEELIIRFRTGRVSQREGDEPVYALLHTGTEAGAPRPRRRVQVVSLSTDTSLEVGANDKALGDYDEAMRGIAAGDFPATPDERRCPNCAYYFLCPAPTP